MRTVRLFGDADPALIAAAAMRGLRFAAPETPDASADLVWCGTRPPPTAAAVRLWVVDGGDAAIVRALDCGADDAVAADAPPELIAARLAALIRRGADRATICFGELRIDLVERRVARCGRTLALLPREYDLLLHFVRHAGRPLPRGALHAALCGLAFDPGTNVIAVHVSRLRAKLDRGFAWPMLRTERGRGYRLVAAPEDARLPDAPCGITA